jgi:hypothetical protein
MRERHPGETGPSMYQKQDRILAIPAANQYPLVNTTQFYFFE